MSNPDQNLILAALPQLVRERIISQLRLVELPLSKAIYEAGQEISHVYFPIDQHDHTI